MPLPQEALHRIHCATEVLGKDAVKTPILQTAVDQNDGHMLRFKRAQPLTRLLIACIHGDHENPRKPFRTHHIKEAVLFCHIIVRTI